MSELQRRTFLATTATGLGITGLLRSLGPLSAADVMLGQGIARFSNDIEPLVRFLEETPQESIIEATARKVKAGLGYRELLAALLLAGVRNIEPRPSVGFKFHAVLVVNSAHLASISSSNEDRWLPIFWAIDNFKSSQARDIREGNWTLPAVDEAALPPSTEADASLRVALDAWDESAADAAITSLVRNAGANRVFELLATYAARDFRSIGHKVIYLSNAFRTLQTIGWEYAEPVMRSLVYAMLNHNGEPNPGTSDLEADRPGRVNREQSAKLTASLIGGVVDDVATRDLVRTLHDCSPTEASDQVAELLRRNVSVQSVWDAMFAAAGELLMRQRGIVSLHSVTTTNAIHYAFQTAGDEQTRKYLLLQNASFLPMFRDAAGRRGDLSDARIDELGSTAPEENVTSIPEVFETMGKSRQQASRQMYHLLAAGGDPQAMVDHARRLVFLKGNDSHDYKFSSAALEDYRILSPAWRNRFLAASTFQLCSPSEATRPLVERIQNAIG
ncbi:hypothetical protein Pla52o_00260 [Novipirellula galeiformis]|uniref:Uncharacterized protein n=1 Tax=Novipirellula galeiformis TaxID=2528004 RepID=A0A5C6CRJ9_9BACT|nr:hypothetical protein [Novipirellula galeiformis]TWU26174.1 hypothetical protein Pla52o_00260 [Novipirellula galeiformis]